MTDIIDFGGPLTRLVSDLKMEIADQAREIKALHDEAARVVATRDMLRLLLADMDAKVTVLTEAVLLMGRNIAELRATLS